MLRRVGLAYLLAPLAALLVIWVSMYVFASVGEPKPLPSGAAAFSLSLVLLFGAPVAYSVAAIAGLPLVRWLQRRGQLRLATLITLGASAGAIAFGACWAVIWSMRLPEFPIVLVGAAAGSLAALVFWIIAVRQPASRPAA
jgi:hypothetical protein